MWRYLHFRPHVIDVNEFTRLWKENTCEKETSKSVGKTEECIPALCQMLHVHTVNTTGKGKSQIYSFVSET